MWYEVDMYVARIPNRGSPPAILLRESYREGGKVKNRTLANLSHWPEHKVDTLARALKGLPPKLELAEASKGLAAEAGVGRGFRDHPQPAARPCGRRAGHSATTGAGRADRPDAVAAAGPGDGHADRGGDRPGLQAGHRAGAAHRDRHQFPG